MDQALDQLQVTLALRGRPDELRLEKSVQSQQGRAAAHFIAPEVAWHARLMVLGWAVLIPIGVLWARFWKIAPGQDFPHQLDDKRWWNAHRWLQIVAVVLSIVAVILVWKSGPLSESTQVHRYLGWSVFVAGLWQSVHAMARGTKGGPTDTTMRGDHFDMTGKRLAFERIHKSLGWLALMVAVATVVTGLIASDAPRWMFAGISAWWTLLVVAFIRWQRAGHAVDTYQTIWGIDDTLPGMKREPIGWGVRRYTESAMVVLDNNRHPRQGDD